MKVASLCVPVCCLSEWSSN